MTKDQEVLMGVVLDYLQTSQKEARNSKACCKAIIHLVESLSIEQLSDLLHRFKSEEKQNEMA